MDRKPIITAILAVMLITLLLFGCATQYQVTEPEVEEEPVELEEEVEETEPEPEEVVEPEPEDEEESEDTDYNFESLPKDQQRRVKMVRNLLDEARDRDENYFFRYSSPSITQTDVWVKGDVLKRTIKRDTELDKYNTYNMVYLNQKTLKAEGYCETSKAKCWEGHGPFKETFSKWDIKTPKDWVMELDNDFTWRLDNKISDQLYHIIDYRLEDKTIRVYVNDYRGWPGKVEVYPPNIKVDSIVTKAALEVYLYDDMDIGGVTDDDVTPGI
jgi:hypothetical protein